MSRASRAARPASAALAPDESGGRRWWRRGRIVALVDDRRAERHQVATSRSRPAFTDAATVEVPTDVSSLDPVASTSPAAPPVRAPFEHRRGVSRRRVDQRFGPQHVLGRAIDRQELRVVYQPIFELATYETIGFEALVRWTSPEYGAFCASDIIEIAESTGQIAQIGEYVLSDALEVVDRARRTARNGSGLWVAVNLSSREFALTDPVARCAEMLKERKVSPGALHFELTETAVMDDVEASIEQIGRLRDLGVEVALDDFGTGHSSLAYLSRLPVSALKIDQSFVWSLTESSRNHVIVEAIVTMARSLGLELCAEGIESLPQLDALVDLDCREGQGYLFSPPLEADDLLAFLQQADTESPATR